MSNPVKWLAIILGAALALVGLMLCVGRGGRSPWWVLPLDLGAAATLALAGYPYAGATLVGAALAGRAVHGRRRARNIRKPRRDVERVRALEASHG